MAKIKILQLCLVCIALIAFENKSKAADSEENKASNSAIYKETPDGELRVGEYEVISVNGAVTRSFCPYTCEMRGIPKEHCRTWQSISNNKLCYVWDTRLPQSAIPIK